MSEEKIVDDVDFDKREWVLRKKSEDYLQDFQLRGDGTVWTSYPGKAYIFRSQERAEKIKDFLNLDAGNRPWFVIERSESLAPAGQWEKGKTYMKEAKEILPQAGSKVIG